MVPLGLLLGSNRTHYGFIVLPTLGHSVHTPHTLLVYMATNVS